MKKYIFIALFNLYAISCSAQIKYPDTIQLQYINLPDPKVMEKMLPLKNADTSRVNFLARMSFCFAFNQAEKSVIYGQQGLELARRLGYEKGIADCSTSLGWGLWGVGNYNTGLQVALKALHLNERMNNEEQIAMNYILLANIYRDFGDYKRALEETRKGAVLYDKIGVKNLVGSANMGAIYDLQNKLDSASVYIRRAVLIDRSINKGRWGWLYYLQGNVQRKLKQYDSAMFYYRTALSLVDYKDIVETYNGIALLYTETGRTDSAIFYASEILQRWKSVSYQRGIQQAAGILANAYKKANQRDSMIKYLELNMQLNNALFNQEKERDIQNTAFNEQMRQDEILRERQRYYEKFKIYGLVTIVLVFLIIALLLWRNNKQKQTANLLLMQQKQKVESTLSELKSTQQQLIQSEKMASLGELTAGIAHEIQNPLNFVNNFSEVNKELVDELEQEADKGNIYEIKAIAKDIRANEEKINHHGKRADAIVKGMLQHSRQTKGVKEPTEINALCDEYLRLSYHGLRAKDKSFSADFKTDFDESIGKVNIVPQDIGRVLLNLFNNAFYAVNEKAQLSANSYRPMAKVTTGKLDNKVEITISDNGNGIAQNIIDKIFQPFFTTKPTGQGTGLGLSLAYDIITKEHNGTIKVESEDGEGSMFIINLPVV